MEAVQPFGENLWLANGPRVRFLGIAFPTRMVVVKLTDGSLWINSPVPATREEAERLNAIGPVAHLVSPTPLHDWRLEAWATFFPHARLWRARELCDTPPSAWRIDIDQVIFRGSIVLSEVEFFHKASRTLIVADFIQNYPVVPERRLRNVLMGLGGVLGGVPLDARLSFIGKRRRSLGRESLRKLLAWDFEKVVVAHGENVDERSRSFVERSFRWLHGKPETYDSSLCVDRGDDERCDVQVRASPEL